MSWSRSADNKNKNSLQADLYQIVCVTANWDYRPTRSPPRLLGSIWAGRWDYFIDSGELLLNLPSPLLDQNSVDGNLTNIKRWYYRAGWSNKVIMAPIQSVSWLSSCFTTSAHWNKNYDLLCTKNANPSFALFIRHGTRPAFFIICM